MVAAVQKRDLSSVGKQPTPVAIAINVIGLVLFVSVYPFYQTPRNLTIQSMNNCSLYGDR